MVAERRDSQPQRAQATTVIDTTSARSAIPSAKFERRCNRKTAKCSSSLSGSTCSFSVILVAVELALVLLSRHEDNHENHWQEEEGSKKAQGVKVRL